VDSIADKRLLEQLEAGDRENDSLQAWFQLKSDRPDEAAPSPERTEALAKDLVRRATNSTGESPENVQVLDQLGSLRVKAKPGFLRVLATQPEVLSARATNLPGYELIRPVKSEPVTIVSPKKRPTSRRKAERG
jgi:hypothetical protein